MWVETRALWVETRAYVGRNPCLYGSKPVPALQESALWNITLGQHVWVETRALFTPWQDCNALNCHGVAVDAVALQEPDFHQLI
jgi:hypothetical protein